MKIGFLVRWLPPRIDGVGDYTWNLACALRELGINVYVFTSEEQRGLPPHQLQSRVTIRNWCGGVVKNEWVFPIIRLWQPKAIIEALKAFTWEAPDWLCFQFVPQLYGRGCMAWQGAGILKELKKRFKCKIAVTFHEFTSAWSLKPRDLFLAAFTRLQTRRMLSVIDSAITTCARYKEILQGLSGLTLPVDVIPVGSNIEPIFISPEELTGLRRQIFPEQAKVFGLFGTLSTFKNFPLAIRALQTARQQGLDAWVYLIGRVESSNPKLFKELMHLAEKLNVKSFIVTSGELSKEDISIQLQMVDVFLFTQVNGISTRNCTLMTALAHGLPVVSLEPQWGLFDHFNIPCGILVDRYNEEDFIKAAVDSLKKSDDLSKKTALSNRDYFYSHFSWPIIAKRYLEVLAT